MKLLNRLERRFGPLGIENLTLYLVFLQSFFFVLLYVRPDLYDRVILNREMVLHGEWWRLLAFALMPPTMSVFFVIFALSFYYLMGTALEHQWGTFRYNIYLLVGYLASIAAVMLVPGGKGTNVYLMGSVLLAFAQLYPNYPVMMFFILRVEVKYLAMFAWVGYLVVLLGGDWSTKVQILAAILNYVLFFHAEIRAGIRTSARKVKKEATKSGPRIGEAFHTCVVCGANDITHRKMEFRYCPLCKGTPCYCIDHINAHAHR